MSTLISNVTITEFKKLKVHQLKRLKSCEVYSDGEYLFTFINGDLEPTGYIKAHAERFGMRSNSVGGETIEEILEAVEA